MDNNDWIILIAIADAISVGMYLYRRYKLKHWMKASWFTRKRLQ